ncbi:hypothetical protein BGZ94_009340 [Podila epigama]|nr:hypothetical protein BGZ94_009340 [Podila epigama]
MNVNALSFSPQGNGGDKTSAGANFRPSVSITNAIDNKKSNTSQRAPLPTCHAKGFGPDQQQRRNKAPHRQNNSRRGNHGREPNLPGDQSAQVQRGSLSVESVVGASSSSSGLEGKGPMSSKSLHEKAKGNSKKNQVSLNHLLNFSFPVREEPQGFGIARRRRNVNYQPFNKDKFINANFRFLLNPKMDYEVFTMDPDVRVRWEDIEQVLISVPQSCPICLQPPVAGRITKCGHVYCFPCILHYLALSDSSNAWRKCPICWDSIYEKDLKSVRNVHDNLDVYDQGEKEIAKQIANHEEVHLEMRLIQRSMNSTLALPRSKTFPLPENVLPVELRGQLPLEFYPDAMVFSRLMISTPSKILAELERDIQSIEFNIEEAKSYDSNAQSEEIVFFEMAIDKIRTRIEALHEDTKFLPKAALNRERILRHYLEHGTDVPKKQPGAETEGSTSPEYIKASNPLSRMNIDPRLDSTTYNVSTDVGMVAHVDTNQNVDNPSNEASSAYYFYQAANGHHLYLQPLDIRILKHHFGRYEHFPDRIMVKVVGIEETSLTEDVRKKCKYMGHLPLGCEVSFLDVLLENIVGVEGVKAFEPELRLRQTKRREKEMREERERLEREQKLNPFRTRNEEIVANDPFFQVEGITARRDSETDLQIAIRLSKATLDESMPTLIEAHSKTTNRKSSMSNGASDGSGATDISQAPDSSSAGTDGDPWDVNSKESNLGETAISSFTKTQSRLLTSTTARSSGGPSTVWGTPSIPIRHQDEYDDDYEDEHNYEADVVLKRGKKKVAILMTNNSRRIR